MKSNKILLILFFLFFLLPLNIFSQDRADSLALYKEGRYREAIINTQNEISQNTNNLDARIIMIWSLIASGEYKKAENEALIGLKIKRFDTRIIQSLGEAYFFQEQYENALKYFQEYIALDPNGARIAKVYNLTADSFFELKRYNESDFAYENAVRFNPNNQRLLMKLAKSRINAKNSILARETLNQILKVYPGNIEAKNLLTELDKNNDNS